MQQNLYRWQFVDHAGVAWIIRAHDEQAARAAAHRFVKNASGSIAAGQIAARSVARY